MRSSRNGGGNGIVVFVMRLLLGHPVEPDADFDEAANAALSRAQDSERRLEQLRERLETIHHR